MSGAVLVTGCTRGLGLELVRLYASAGHDVLAVARPGPGVEALRSVPGLVTVVPVDITDSAAPGVVREALQGRALDVLVNNAALRGGADDDVAASADEWLRLFATNVVAPAKLVEAAQPALRRSLRPRVVMVSSATASFAQDRGAGGGHAYRASKAALNKLTQLLARDLLPFAITVAAVHPGWMRTRMGGPKAPFSAAERAARMVTLIERLHLPASGRFFDADGARLAW